MRRNPYLKHLPSSKADTGKLISALTELQSFPEGQYSLYEYFVQFGLEYDLTNNGCIRYYYNKQEPLIQNSIRIRTVNDYDTTQFRVKNKDGTHFDIMYSPIVNLDDMKRHVLAGSKSRLRYKAVHHTSYIKESNGKVQQIPLSDSLAQAILAKTGSIGCTIKSERVILFDIDNHSSIEQNCERTNAKLYAIIKMMDYKHPFYIEKSCINGGYHVYYRFAEKGNPDEIYAHYTKKLKELGVDNVDVNTPRKKFILPMSATYQPLKVAIRKTPYYSPGVSLKFTDSKDLAALIADRISCLFSKTENLPLLEQKPETVPLINVALNGLDSTSIFEKNANNNADFSPILPSFPLYRNNRYHTHMKLAIACYSRGLSYDLFKQKTVENNYGAKDIDTPQKLERVCQQLWKWCQEKLTITPFTPQRISDEWIENRVEGFPIRKLVTIILQRYKFSKNIKEYERCATLLVHQLLHQYLDNYRNPKTIRDDVRLTRDIKQKLTECNTFIATSSLEKMKSHFKMRVNVHELYNHIVNLVFVKKEIKPGLFYSSIRNLSWCRQYVMRRLPNSEKLAFADYLKRWLYHIIKRYIGIAKAASSLREKTLYYGLYHVNGIVSKFLPLPLSNSS